MKRESWVLKAESSRAAGVKRELDPEIEILSESVRGRRRIELDVIDLSGD